MTDQPAKPSGDEPELDNEGDEASPPEPEPWTPERVREWNAYYDVYVAAFVLALVFLVSSNWLGAENSALWNLLQSGRRIVATGSPLNLDGQTGAGAGHRWVNIPWLFELANYGVFQGVAQTFPPEAGAPPPASGTTPQGEKVGIGVLIGLAALLRVVTAFVLLSLRHRSGPGLWWVSLCVVVALGATLGPEPVGYLEAAAEGEAPKVAIRAVTDVQLGGLVGPRSVSPAGWGLLLLALELWLIQQATVLGRRSRAFALVPLFLVWANLDESFAIGLIVLALVALGRRLDLQGIGGGRPVGLDRATSTRPGAVPLGMVLLACFGVCFLNPAHVFGVLGGFASILQAFAIPDGVPTATPIRLFGEVLQKQTGESFAAVTRWYHLGWIGVGLLSFLVNRQRFSWTRFLPFAGLALLWVMMTNLVDGPFAVLLAVVVALNGQEWYHATVGTEGRLGAGWVFWSTGGRLVTIALVALAIFKATTGYGAQPGDSRFGFGFDPDDFPFESVDALAPITVQGNILNTTLAQGDLLTWRTDGKRRAFIDSKSHLYSPDEFRQFAALRRAIRDEDLATWQPILDANNVSLMMLEPSDAPVTYTRLMASPNWIPISDDGSVVLFGRADSHANAADLAYFRANRLDAADLAYKRPKPVPIWTGAPRTVSETVDRIFANRFLGRTQPHVAAARRWLQPVTAPVGVPYLPSPAHCLLAIRELRAALSAKNDDPAAYRLLIQAYRSLIQQESALLTGIDLTPETVSQILPIQPQLRALPNRTQQLLTALNFALQTLPPGQTADDRRVRADLNFNLAQIALQVGYGDIARDRLKAIVDLKSPVGELPEAQLREISRRLGELNEGVGQVQNRLSDMTIQRQGTSLDRARVARSAGAPDLAIRELEEAEQSGGVQGVRPILIDLLCEVGRPDRALDLMTSLNLNIDDPSLSSGPGAIGAGTATYRQGLVYFLLGDTRNAEALWGERSIPQIRSQGLVAPVEATKAFLQGQFLPATRSFLDLPQGVDKQAQWEFDLGMAALEGGDSPSAVAQHLRTALELEPNLTVRPVIAYYLTQLGQDVPPLRSARVAPAPATPPAPNPAAPVLDLPANPFEVPRP